MNAAQRRRHARALCHTHPWVGRGRSVSYTGPRGTLRGVTTYEPWSPESVCRTLLDLAGKVVESPASMWAAYRRRAFVLICREMSADPEWHRARYVRVVDVARHRLTTTGATP